MPKQWWTLHIGAESHSLQPERHILFPPHLILTGYVYDIDNSELQEYNASLAKIGNNLNQIAKRMNATDIVYAANITEVKELMSKVWQS